MERTLSTILELAAEKAIEKQRDDGSFPAGVNGPYNDPETPVRVTSHWLFTLSRLCSDQFNSKIEPENLASFEEAAERAIEYLQSEAAKPYDKTFRHRTSKGKDECNGLIGQAWTIEALVEAGRVFDRTELIDLSEDVFLIHPFDEDTGLWCRVDTDGTVLGFDRTFNHQLWFAAMGGELAIERGGQVDEQVRRFLDQLTILLNVTKDGQVRHLLRPSFSTWKFLRILFNGFRRELARNTLLEPIRPPSNRRKLRRKAIGYQSFNLYGLAMLQEQYPNHAVWEYKAIDRALEFANSDRFRQALTDNPYGYPYNASGIELAYALSEFGAIESEGVRKWLRQQFERTYDPDTNRMDRNNPDPVTLTARLYEATRLNDTVVRVDPI